MNRMSEPVNVNRREQPEKPIARFFRKSGESHQQAEMESALKRQHRKAVKDAEARVVAAAVAWRLDHEDEAMMRIVEAHNDLTAAVDALLALRQRQPAAPAATETKR
jgi:hypothetical protein